MEHIGGGDQQRPPGLCNDHIVSGYWQAESLIGLSAVNKEKCVSFLKMERRQQRTLGGKILINIVVKVPWKSYTSVGRVLEVSGVHSRVCPNVPRCPQDLQNFLSYLVSSTISCAADDNLLN